MVVGVIAIGQTLIILTAGIDLSVRHGDGARQHRHDQVRRRLRPAHARRRSPAASPSRPCSAWSTACSSRASSCRPSSSRSAPSTSPLRSRSSIPTRRPSPTFPTMHDVAGQHLPASATPPSSTARADDRALPATWFWLRETARPPCLRGRQQPRGHPPVRHRDRPRAAVGVYVLAGVFYGIASLLTVSRTGAGDPNAGQTENLDAITAVVLGGTSLFGGRA